ncbi:hypothetical protein V5799_016227 [Amblyomma americanum]|uniref:Uncharacterized protein n=1 Tax=Amblyomma americanum TaxID=6943 RepID=A0AAQ4F6W5_AMBAM
MHFVSEAKPGIGGLKRTLGRRRPSSYFLCVRRKSTTTATSLLPRTGLKERKERHRVLLDVPLLGRPQSSW